MQCLLALVSELIDNTELTCMDAATIREPQKYHVSSRRKSIPFSYHVANRYPVVMYFNNSTCLRSFVALCPPSLLPFLKSQLTNTLLPMVESMLVDAHCRPTRMMREMNVFSGEIFTGNQYRLSTRT
eukprot:4404430-Amphidinium_carterae.1